MEGTDCYNPSRPTIKNILSNVEIFLQITNAQAGFSMIHNKVRVAKIASPAKIWRSTMRKTLYQKLYKIKGFAWIMFQFNIALPNLSLRQENNHNVNMQTLIFPFVFTKYSEDFKNDLPNWTQSKQNNQFRNKKKIIPQKIHLLTICQIPVNNEGEKGKRKIAKKCFYKSSLNIIKPNEDPRITVLAYLAKHMLSMIGVVLIWLVIKY